MRALGQPHPHHLPQELRSPHCSPSDYGLFPEHVGPHPLPLPCSAQSRCLTSTQYVEVSRAAFLTGARWGWVVSHRLLLLEVGYTCVYPCACVRLGTMQMQSVCMNGGGVRHRETTLHPTLKTL